MPQEVVLDVIAEQPGLMVTWLSSSEDGRFSHDVVHIETFSRYRKGYIDILMFCVSSCILFIAMLNIRWYDKWIILACAFCNYILVNGVIYCFGVLYVELLNRFGEEKDVTAWIGSIQLGLVNLGGVFAGSLIRRFGIMKTVLTGTLLSSIGYLASSITTSIYTMYVTYGALPGLGLVMISLSSLIAVGQHFDEHQGLAMGICQSGGSVGGFIFNPMLQALIESYGWRGALLILAGILMHGALFGLVMHTLERPYHEANTKNIKSSTGKCEKERKRANEDKPFIPIKDGCQENSVSIVKQTVETLPKDEEKCLLKDYLDKANANFDKENQDRIERPSYLISDTTEDIQTVNKIPSESNFDKFLTVVHQIIPYKIFKHRPTCILLISSHVRSFGFFVPFMLLPDLAVGKGISVDWAAWLASGMGISGAVSRVLLGWIGGFPSVDRLYLYIFCLLVGGVLTAVCPLLTLYGLLMMYACIFGFLMGGEVSLTPVICSDVAGKDKLPETYGMLRTLCGIGALCGTPLSGWLFEVTGGYTVSFILTGVLITFSGILLLPLKCQR